MIAPYDGFQFNDLQIVISDQKCVLKKSSSPLINKINIVFLSNYLNKLILRL